jgi:hypothetical protein
VIILTCISHGDVRYTTRITAARIKYTRKTAAYIWTDYKTNREISKDRNRTPVLDKIKRHIKKWLRHVKRTPCSRLTGILKEYRPEGRRNQGRPLKILLHV